MGASLAGLAAAALAEWPAHSAQAPTPVADALTPPRASDVRLGGYLGEQINRCLRGRVMAQDIERVVQPFRDRRETGDGDWRSEYWGKWVTSAVLGYEYQPTAAHRAVVERAARELIATRDDDGYIGTRTKEHRLEGWDVWGRKYVLLGLLAAYDATGDKAILDAARRHQDTLMAEVGPGRANIAELGLQVWKGLPPSSVLEPTVLLYRRTGDPKYLDFARYIVADWSRPNRLSPHGMRLIEQARGGTHVADFGAAKAYEMTSCFEGLCELYRATGRPEYLTACRRIADDIIQNELFIVGSGSSREVWFGGRRKQTQVNPDLMETCVTATWMKYCFQLLRLTGDSRYADQMEVSLYNALLGSQKPDGSWWNYYMPLNGTKRPSHVQHADVGLSCCVTNGPRALLLTPAWAVMTGKAGPVVNLYCPGEATLTLASGNKVRIAQQTEYPKSDRVDLTIQPHRPETFALRLRVPAWSRRTSLTVNGKPVASHRIKPGTYAVISRRWNKDDRVTLTLDLRGRVVPDPGGTGQVAVLRGPVVLALDKRLGPPDGGAGRTFAARDGALALAPAPDTPGVWMAFSTPCVSTPDGTKTTLTLCDYASAGNTWSPESRFRVWLPQPLDAGATGLEGARWVWFAGDPGDLTVSAPAGARFFRRAFDLPAGVPISQARLRITADDAFTLSVNGAEAGRGDAWQSAHTFDLTARLTPGRNVLAVAATNEDKHTVPAAAGLVARLEIRPKAGRPTVIVTDENWKASARADGDWKALVYDDGAWQAAKILGVYGCPPWGVVE